MAIRAALCFIASLTALPVFSATVSNVSGPATTQLPLGVAPIHYDVSITPDAAALTFAGKVRITMVVDRPTTTITLNANGIAFNSAVITSMGDAVVQTPAIEVNNDAQTATFRLGAALPKGRYKLVLDYKGRIGQSSVGLFALDYPAAHGKARALYTQFASSYARRMIPSWDEPYYKASFTVEANVPASDMAVSNMPVTSRTDLGNDRVLVRFAPSPKMSTYLLFFALGDFERLSAKVDGTELGVVTRRGATAQGQYLLDSSKDILREFNRYFGTTYPLPKLDNIAAPGSGIFSAMENWGAIMSFESVALLDPSISTPRDRQKVFSIGAHEISHQWFGNLVTMNWWDDIWLNEGFASWIEARLTRRMHPEWNTSLDAVNERELAMAEDAVATTHPVIQHVSTVEQASQVFDRITYQKGAAVIGMLEEYVGETAWRNGVRSYMRNNAYGSTVSDDFWKQIEKAANKPVTAIAHDFTLQSGIPMIRVEQARCVRGATNVTLRQEEFTMDRPDKKALLWRVPVIAQVVGNPKPVRVLVTGGKAALKLPGCGPVVVNAGQTGYYRVLYAPENFISITNSFASLPAVDQMGMLADTWAQAQAGLQDPADIMKMMKAIPMTADPQVWGKVSGLSANIYRLYRGDAQGQARFGAYATSRLKPILAQLGWTEKTGESVPHANLRSDLINTLGAMGDPEIVTEARKRYSSSSPGAVPAALRKTIYSIVAMHADAATWESMRVLASKEASPQTKRELYRQLALTTDPVLAKRALDLALAGEAGAPNTRLIFGQVADLHGELAYGVATGAMNKLESVVDADSRNSFYPGLARNLSDPAMAAKLRAFASANFADGARRPTEEVIATIEHRLMVTSKRLPSISRWLSAER